MDGLIEVVLDVANKRAEILRSMKDAVLNDSSPTCDGCVVRQLARKLFSITVPEINARS
jgi:hypothetical protein